MSIATFAEDAVGVPLDALVAEAGMMTRVDRKYLLAADELDAVLTALDVPVAVLDIDGRRSFGYRSTYFDTADLRCYRDAGQKRRRRFKVRTRDYLDTGTTWLEVKTVGPRGTTVKRRVAHPDGALLGAAGEAYVSGLLGLDAATLRPTLTTEYERVTLQVPADPGRAPSRATIDTALAWRDRATGRAVARPGLAVVETKGGAAPSPVDRALWRAGHRPRGVSKYGAGLALVRPELAPLKWHRVVHRDLAA